MISFVVPAYNEEQTLPACLERLTAAATRRGRPFETIVVDDASTDRTAEVARARGTRVIAVACRQIAATRNAGARAARGDVLVFVDADTRVGEDALRGVVRAIEGGAVGGGARVSFDDVPGPARIALRAFIALYHGLGLAAGCFLFARRAAFEAAGGFDERYFASEEVRLSRALRRLGRFVILRERVLTSGRKLRMHRLAGIPQLLRIALRGPRALRRREGLDLWYDGRREPAGDDPARP